MALGETESGLFGLLANRRRTSLSRWVPLLSALVQAVFKTAPECFLISPHNPIIERSDSGPRAHIECTLRPLSALLTQYRRSIDPITARGQNRGAEPTRPEAVD